MNGLERRRSFRQVHRGYGTISHKHGSQPCNLLNLSDTGALVAIHGRHDLKENDDLTLHVELDQGIISALPAKAIRAETDFIAVRYTDLSPENQTHLETALSA